MNTVCPRAHIIVSFRSRSHTLLTNTNLAVRSTDCTHIESGCFKRCRRLKSLWEGSDLVKLVESVKSPKHKPAPSDRHVFGSKKREKLCEYYYIVFVWCGLEWAKCLCLCKPRSWQILSHSGVKILVRDSINDINSQDRRYRINKSTDLKNKHKRRLLTVQWTLWVMFVHYYPNYSL